MQGPTCKTQLAMTSEMEEAFARAELPLNRKERRKLAAQERREQRQERIAA